MTVVTIAFILVAALLALLSVPVDVAFSGRWPIDSSSRVVVGWGFGLFEREIDLSATPEETKPEPTPKPAAKATPERSDKRALRVRTLLTNSELRRRFGTMLSKLWQSVRKESVQVRIRVGTGDPAETGQLWAVGGPLSGWLRARFGPAVQLTPDFDDEVFEAQGSGRVSFMPSRLLGHILAFGFSPVVWRGIRDARVR